MGWGVDDEGATVGSHGWFAYQPIGVPDSEAGLESAGDLKPQFADVGRLARRAVQGVVKAARAGERGHSWAELLHDHLLGVVQAGGRQLDEDLPVVDERWSGYEHVNVQSGLDAWLAEGSRTHRIVGMVGFQHRSFGLADLLTYEPGSPHAHGLRPGNLARVNLPSGPDGEVVACVKCALYLVTDGPHRLAILLRGPDPESGALACSVQIAASDPDAATRAATEIREQALARNVFRGQVLSFGGEMFGHGQTLMQFHRRPELSERELILPPEVLAAVRRQVVEVARHKRQLLAAGQHLKRGVLLYGPPGVGKTHTVRYLTSMLAGTTVIQLTGQALHLISEACQVARALAPSMLIVEDVDLIAEDRGEHPGHHPMLFQLLNEMDGLAEDADVVFVLTTNRADLLEPALAARPGRVDQAVELTLPDAEARRHLFDLYRGGLIVDTSRLYDVIEQTEGVTASFLKELLRRAALLAAARSPEYADSALAVSADDLDAALAELLDTRNAMTRVVLGG
jgi:ATPase family associated with various cellular activities (AAA)